MDPKKLQAFAQSQPASHKPKKGSPAAAPAPTQKADDKFKEGGSGKYGHLIPILEEHAAELQECCDELDHEALMDPEAEMGDADIEILKEGARALPDNIKEAVMQAFGDGISMEDALRLAEHLETEGMIDDAECVAGYLVKLGDLVKSGELGADEDDEDDEEEVADEDEDYGDDAEDLDEEEV